MLCKVLYRKTDVEIQDKFESKALPALWAGRSPTKSGAHALLPITFDGRQGRWHVGKPIERVHVRVKRTVFPLSLKPVKGGSLKDMHSFVDQFHPSAADTKVYAVSKIVNKREVNGKVQYKVKWEGSRSSKDDWEPVEHLVEWGASQAVADYESKAALKTAGAVHLLAEQSDADLATQMLMRKHKLDGTMEQWVHAYDEEFDGCLAPGPLQRLQEIFGEERENLLKGRLTRLRMNPEDKKDGRKKMRLLVRGDTEPEEWIVGPTDSPIASLDSIRMLLFSGEITPSDEPEEMATCDAKTAFRQSTNFGEDEVKRYVAYKAHKRAKTRVFQLLGSLYGSVDASMRWYKTLAPFLERPGFIRGENGKCVFVHPETHVRIALHVDDYLVRGVRAELDKFFEKLCAEIQHKPPKFLSDSDELYFVGIRITETMENGKRWFHMDQHRGY